MAVKLHRCKNQWVKLAGHPCWRVEKSLIDAGVDYDRVPEAWLGKRETMVEHTGQKQFPAIEFEDGSWYREESQDIAAAIRAGRLNEMHGKTPATRTAA